MKKLTLVPIFLLALVTASVGQSQPAPPNSVRAVSYAGWQIQSQGPNSFSFSPTGVCYVNGGLGTAFFPFATNAPLFIQDSPSDSNNEVVTPSSVTSPGASGCGFAASPSHSHTQFYILSGTAGLQEALNQLKTSSTPAQTIILDQAWYRYISATGGTASSVIAAAAGSTSINLVDQTTAPWTWYSWNGTAYVAASGQAAGNGSSWTYFTNTQNVTLSTGGTTTDTTANVLPANSVIDMVQGVVSTAITGSCSGWALGDATTAARFRASDTTLTVGEGGNGAVMLTTGIASATTGMYQASAAKLRITCATGAASAGAVRIVVYGRTYNPPTQ